MDSDVRWYIQRLETDITNLRLKATQDAARITKLETLVANQAEALSSAQTEIEILKQGGNL